jgi:hypothetical protein
MNRSKTFSSTHVSNFMHRHLPVIPQKNGLLVVPCSKSANSVMGSEYSADTGFNSNLRTLGITWGLVGTGYGLGGQDEGKEKDYISQTLALSSLSPLGKFCPRIELLDLCSRYHIRLCRVVGRQTEGFPCGNKVWIFYLFSLAVDTPYNEKPCRLNPSTRVFLIKDVKPPFPWIE